MNEKHIYLDNAATTKMDESILEDMMPYFCNNFGNASSIYLIGRESKKAIEAAREKVANAIGADSKEIYFTSSGTESDNWAIRGVLKSNAQKGKHVITTAVEHPAVLDTCKKLEKDGYEVTYLEVDKDGLISLQDLKNAIKPTTVLISVMFANNEIGTILPIKEIGEIARENNITFHTDAVQAIGNVEVDVVDQNIDLLSLTAHKFYGPKGVGALYIKKGVKISPILTGGHQERGRRASTENVPAIVGLGSAIEKATTNIREKQDRLIYLREKLINGIKEKVDYIKINGHREKRLPGNVNISFEFIEGESLLLMLDMKGIYASSGSACSSGSLDPSHVLMAIGLSHEIAHGSLRLSLGKDTTEEEVDYVINEIPAIVQRLREMSPLYEVVKKK